MPTSSAARARVVARLAILLVLAGVVALFVLPTELGKTIVVVAIAAGSVVGALACVVLAQRRPRFVPVLTALAFVGVAAPVLYLRSLPADSAAIPIGEVGAMFVSLVVLATTFFLLAADERTSTDRFGRTLG